MASDSEIQNPLINVNISDVTKLSSVNYLTWSLQIKALLRRNGLMEFIDESKTPPPAMITIDGTTSPNPKHTSWQAQDCLINSALIDAIETPHLPLIATTSTSLEAWTILASTYGDKPEENQSTKTVEDEQMKTVADVVAFKKKVVGMVQTLLESYKEEQEICRLQTQALEEKHKEELRLREHALEIERERTESLKLQIETLRGKSEIDLEEMKQVVETCKKEEESLTLQVKTLQENYDQELSLRKETEDALYREKEELEIVKGLLESYNKEADTMREERDNALKIVDEIITKQLEEHQQPPQSFICPITHEVMEDPQIAADGFTYEAEAIREWLNTGHETSPMTNLKLLHYALIPNRTLRSAIEEFGLVLPPSLS